MEEDLILNIVGVGRPVRLFLGCSVYSKLRGPRSTDVQVRREGETKARVAKMANSARRSRRTRKPSLTNRYRVGQKPAQPLDSVSS